jgi:anti-sigma regulatory factor (Ser/Thr protein kinase)
MTADAPTILRIPFSEIRSVLDADVIVGKDFEGREVSGIYASDLMSDVLAYGKPDSCLLSGLNTIQTLISAFMAEFLMVVLIRGKRPDDQMVQFARQKDLVLFSTKYDMYDACIQIARGKGMIQSGGLAPDAKGEKEESSRYTFVIDGSDFASAGMVSTQIKSILKQVGYEMSLIRRVGISVYEAEMNVVMHARRGEVLLTISNSEITVMVKDVGKGIADIDKAMTEGYSTATEDQRAMGFGAGMGLPNIKKNSDKLEIKSVVGEGTELKMRFFVQ